MVGVLYDNQPKELFFLPNNWYIRIDYGENYEDGPNFSFYFDGRTSSKLRRTQLYKNNILIEELIEDNPDYRTSKQLDTIRPSWNLDNEEFERKIYFDNGYIFKIEYWFSKKKKEPNRGIYFSKFHKLILYNSNNEIISEIIKENPNYIDQEIMEQIDEDLV